MPILTYILKPRCAFLLKSIAIIRKAMRIRDIPKLIVDMHITFAVTMEGHRDFFKCPLDKSALLCSKKKI